MTVDVVVDAPVRSAAREPWFVADPRKVAAAGCAGIVADFLVNAAGGRLAMMLLARLNPAATGLTSDDGFRIGQFDLATHP